MSYRTVQQVFLFSHQDSAFFPLGSLKYGSTRSFHLITTGMDVGVSDSNLSYAVSVIK